MINHQLVSFVQKSFEAGTTDRQIRETLLQQGWSGEDVDEALARARTTINQKTTGGPHPSKRKSGALLFLGYILSSVIVSGALLTILARGLLLAFLFGGAEQVLVLIFVLPQVFLVPLFLFFYRRQLDQKKILYADVVLAIFAVVAVFFAVSANTISPKQAEGNFAAARNARRETDLQEYSTIVDQYVADHKKIPDQITTSSQHIGKNGADLCSLFVPQYINILPSDPNGVPVAVDSSNPAADRTDCNSDYDTSYAIQRNGNQVILSTPLAEGGKNISLTWTPAQ